MKIFVTMKHHEDIEIKEIDLDVSKYYEFNFEEKTLKMSFLLENNILHVITDEPLALLQDGRADLLDLKNEFFMPVGVGFSLVYPNMDIFTKFDINY